MSKPWVLSLLSFATLLAVGAWVTPASGDVSIGRADTEGERLNRVFLDDGGVSDIYGGLSDVAVGGDHIYWIRSIDGAAAIGRATLNASQVNPSFVTGLSSVRGLTANDQYLYWGGDSIGRARLDGTDVQPNLLTPSGGARDVAASDQYLYWSSEVGIGRASLDGMGADPGFIDTGAITGTIPYPPQGSSRPSHLAINSAQAFWVDLSYETGERQIRRASIDGSGEIQTVVSDGGYRGDYYGSLAADDTCVFYGLSWGMVSNEIRSFDGSPASHCSAPSLATSADYRTSDPIWGVAVSGDHVYWTHTAADGVHCTLDQSRRNQSQHGKRIRFRIWFDECERVGIRASGRVKVGTVHYDLKRMSRTVPPTEPWLALRPTREDARELVTALKAGAEARANIELEIKDGSGFLMTRRYFVRLSRGSG